MFSRIDTVIARVRDLEKAKEWYAEKLGLRAVFEDPEERLAVLGVGEGSSLTLWQLRPGEDLPSAAARGTYPIFAVDDALQAHAHLRGHDVEVDEPVDAGEVCYFGFRDLDGNRLEACEVRHPGA